MALTQALLLNWTSTEILNLWHFESSYGGIMDMLLARMAELLGFVCILRFKIGILIYRNIILKKIYYIN
jgi:hypothetical protein